MYLYKITLTPPGLCVLRVLFRGVPLEYFVAFSLWELKRYLNIFICILNDQNPEGKGSCFIFSILNRNWNTVGLFKK